LIDTFIDGPLRIAFDYEMLVCNVFEEDRMFKRSHRLAIVIAFAFGLAPTSSRAQDIEILMALPAPTLTFSSAFLAEDAGFYKKEGLKVSHRILVGVASPNAVIAGSADFTIGTGPVFLRAAAAGQRLFAIANLIDRPLVELVLRKDVADGAGINGKMPLAERAKALKGKTIAIQGVGSIIHAWERLVAHRGGLDVEKDVRIAPMDPPAMLPALVAKQVDGFATSLPFTTEAVLKGNAVMLASAATDAPDLLPFSYGLIYTRPDMCTKQREKCVRVVRALAAANRFILEKPDEALDILKKRFDKMDQQVLAAAWKTVSAAHAKDLHVVVPGLDHSQQVSLEARLLADKDTLKSFDGLYTDEFIH
jgi:sulfonate transport system substrate-binding protein